MTDLERLNRHRRRHLRWLQQQPPKWRAISWLLWLMQEPR